MPWIAFKDRKPETTGYLITRAKGWKKEENFFDDHRQWDGSWLQFPLKPHAISHWWDGEPNFDIAVKEWENGT